MTNIGLFGGTFDPIHLGHTRMAAAFADELALDCVIFIPAGDPYHKDHAAQAPGHARLAMTELAIARDARFAASDCDLRRQGATYTIDTINIFREIYPSAQLWWLMGSDSLLHLPTWHRWQQLFALTHFAIAGRDQDSLAHVPAVLREPVSRALAEAENPQAKSGKLRWLKLSPAPISSTQIRAALAQGRMARTLTEWLDPAVAEYIDTRRLYRSRP